MEPAAGVKTSASTSRSDGRPPRSGRSQEPVRSRTDGGSRLDEPFLRRSTPVAVGSRTTAPDTIAPGRRAGAAHEAVEFVNGSFTSSRSRRRGRDAVAIRHRFFRRCRMPSTDAVSPRTVAGLPRRAARCDATTAPRPGSIGAGPASDEFRTCDDRSAAAETSGDRAGTTFRIGARPARARRFDDPVVADQRLSSRHR